MKKDMLICHQQPIFLNELSLISGGNQSDQNGNNNETNDNKIFAVRDAKKQIILVALSPTECSLWIKRINEARKQFMDHEKSYLQRQRSSKSLNYHIFIRLVLHNIISELMSNQCKELIQIIQVEEKEGL